MTDSPISKPPQQTRRPAGRRHAHQSGPPNRPNTARTSHNERGATANLSWTFAVKVDAVVGSEGTWLRSELTHAVRDLLLWAHGDRTAAKSEVDWPAA